MDGSITVGRKYAHTVIISFIQALTYCLYVCTTTYRIAVQQAHVLEVVFRIMRLFSLQMRITSRIVAYA